jgi:hypothetical protein
MLGWPRSVLVPGLWLAMTACSNKTIGRDEARSKIKSALSFTAESEMFIDYIRQGRSTRPYAQGHALYLEDEVKRSIQELGHGVPGSGTQNAIRECIAGLNSLDRELARIPTALGNDSALADAQERLRNIQKTLERARLDL